ncbi:MAG TPA: pyridoxal phosphate-dependent aminotransferase, partial [Patescibacteria group bacterium]|nr:pyridoxal phosphate-dependent aminotransferase [Patescibacteria group bacterium]
GLDNKAKALKAQGIPVINLSAGEPDFDTPKHIKQEAIDSLLSGETKYSAPQGLPEIRKAIADKLHKENNIEYDPSQIVVGIGGKQILYSIFQVLCDQGDEVIIPVPTWLTFVEQVKLAGGKPVLVKLTQPFKVTAQAIEKALTKKTKIVLLNSPSNPTGAMVDEKELQKIADLVVKHNLWVVADEIYEKLTYLSPHRSIASLNEKIKARTITTNGFAKSYAMTGWRLGYAAGPKEIIEKMTNFQVQTISNVPVFIQRAGVAGLTGDQSSVATMHKEFTKRREFLIKAFGEITELSFTNPEGAFYFFISIEKLLGKKYKTATEWCDALLEKEHVAVVPGDGFLYPGYFRLSFASSLGDLKKAVEKIKKFIYDA